MTKRVEQQVLGFLLDALDDSERDTVAERLKTDPEYRLAWQVARRRLGKLNQVDPSSDVGIPMPPRLTQRTVDMVVQKAETSGPLSDRYRKMTPSSVPHSGNSRGGRYRITWVDMAIVGTVALIAGLILAPAVHSMRSQSRLVACQNNLHDVGMSLAHFSQKNHETFPEVPGQGKLATAGIYAPILAGFGLLTDPRSLVCPDSTLADARNFHLATINEVTNASGSQALELKNHLGGSYGYCLDHLENGQPSPTRNRNREFFAIMADEPSTARVDRQSDNHGGYGQNVLFEDMHVKFLAKTHGEESLDDIFENDNHEVAAGLQCDDSVIVGSSTPVVYTINQ